jgi:hypothetical protein
MKTYTLKTFSKCSNVKVLIYLKKRNKLRERQQQTRKPEKFFETKMSGNKEDSSKRRLIDNDSDAIGDTDLESQSSSSVVARNITCCSAVRWHQRRRRATLRFCGNVSFRAAGEDSSKCFKTVILSIAELGFVFAFWLLIVYILQLPICDLFFACGCSAPWSGGIDHCNVFNTTGPRCPW